MKDHAATVNWLSSTIRVLLHRVEKLEKKLKGKEATEISIFEALQDPVQMQVQVQKIVKVQQVRFEDVVQQMPKQRQVQKPMDVEVQEEDEEEDEEGDELYNQMMNEELEEALRQEKLAREQSKREQEIKEKLFGEAQKAPRMPMGAFQLFMQEKRPSITWSMTEVAKQLSEEWSGMADDDKKPFDEKAFKLKADYVKEYAEYKANPNVQKFEKLEKSINKTKEAR